jgi:hypothetical protein
LNYTHAQPIIIDINLGTEKHVVKLDPGQDMKAVAKSFSEEHNLDVDLQQQLLEQLDINLAKATAKI